MPDGFICFRTCVYLCIGKPSMVFHVILLLIIKKQMTEMKESIKGWRTWCAVRLLVAVALVGTVFMACSGDDEAVSVTYAAGFDAVHSTSEDFLDDLALVEQAYMEALNVSGSPFTLTGTIEECDAQVKAACERAEAEVEAMGLTEISFTYVVTNRNTNQEVYSYTYSN